MNRCYACFESFDDRFDVCPFCGAIHTTEPKEPIYLRPGTVLVQRYEIGRAVGAGGFGVIYTAWDRKLETVVAVKEFFASRLMTRAVGEAQVIINQKARAEFDYRKARFLAEARNMAKFGAHRSIPNVFEFFEDNGTAYIVMELLHGQSLHAFLQQNGTVDKDFALLVANEVGLALKSMHEKGIIHRDVAPDNIFIASENELRIKLLDLGAAKLADSSDAVIDIILKPGYSPIEQYDNTKNIGPWTDVYALGATLYRMLTGEKPDESTNRRIADTVVPPHEINEAVSENLSNAVMKAIAVERHMRFRTVIDFLKAINGERRVLSLEKERRLRKRRRFTGVLAGCLAAIIAAVSVFQVYSLNKAQQGLPDADISLWFSLAQGADTSAYNEQTAIESLVADFTDKHPNVKVEVRAIPEAEYAAALAQAADNGELPTVFESTDLSDAVLEKARDVTAILRSEQAERCLFLDQYDTYYLTQKRVPLAMEVPMAYVITEGATTVSYEKDYFESTQDFGVDVAADMTYRELLTANFPTAARLADRSTFWNAQENTCAVLLSSSMAMNAVKSELATYGKRYVYYRADQIDCRFTYEWSLGDGNDSEVQAAERLLSWMLGHPYQNTLMITKCNDGQIPLNTDSFHEKIGQAQYAPIENIYQNFVFR